ncbi:hypothetical protein ACJIZ3_024471 [Penstemon smallii]|uniref:Uncharacterized protein n=1 Tax=Penstemon smallii TaxID=265156 RepID=A0ABD3TSW2_9LAMI
MALLFNAGKKPGKSYMLISNYFVPGLRLEMSISLLHCYKLGLELKTSEIPNPGPVILLPIEPQFIFQVILFNYKSSKSSFTKCTSKIFFLRTLDT